MRLFILVFAFACGPLALWNTQGQRALPALGIGCILFLLLRRSPGWGVILTLLYLSFLGGIRRWIVPMFGVTPADPLLLIAPALVLVNFLNLLLTRNVPSDTRLARMLLWLLAIMFLQIFNPLQGGIGVGLAGALFTIVPILWYYYGRGLCSETIMRRLLIAVVGLSLVGALYGLCQTYFGLLPVEKEWVELNKSSYNALYISDQVIRAFSFFTSAQEYIQVVSMGFVVLWAAFLRGTRFALLALPLLGTAIFLSSMRGAVVVTLFACAVVWAVQGRTVAAWVPRIALAVALAASGLSWSLQQVQTETYDKRTQALITHQVKGLLNPGDSTNRESTGSMHAAMMANGIIEGFRVPVGRGLGSTTLAAAKFNTENRNGSTESDISDAFAALGFAGGFVYLAVVFFVLSGIIHWWRSTGSWTALASLGIVVVHIGHWLHGGSYAATMIVWFVIGGMERALLNARLTQRKIEKARLQSEATATESGRSETQAAPMPYAVPPNTPRGRWLARQNLLLKSASQNPGRKAER